MTAPAASRRFDGYAAWVTGAGRGIGAAVARRLAAEGAQVLVTDVVVERAEKTAAAIGAVPYRCDVADDASVRAAARHAVDRFGRLDVLVNNACSCHADPGRLEDQEDAPWFADFDITVHGAFRCARAALPHLAAASGRGSIVNIGSVNAEVYFGSHAYSAAKAALASFTRTLAVESAPRGVRVNLVEPGTVRTDVWDGHEDLLERARHCYPLGRIGEPEDIASAVAFLASRDAAWTTGATLRTDGGLLVSNLGMNRAFEGG